MGIAEALRAVQAQINNAAIRSGRDPAGVKLVAVSKTVDIKKVIEAMQAGAVIFGENRVQEAGKKITELRAQNTDIKTQWHLIGNLQKNKVRPAVELFDLIHSVDSSVLAEEINKHAGNLGKQQRVLVQVKLSDEATKHGIAEDSLMSLLSVISNMDHLRLEGLMTIPPYFEDPEMARPYFRKLRQLADKAVERGFTMHELSMGMSNDFEVAIEEGATLVRVGTAIFGERFK
ncbi:MAG: YggS family pyridoxal phosphate-dependent enzyme [Nitrospirae bacterium]|nr:YggS family pyridoxal phosphate-dependent enzyme [Nitrospirota bacterium]